VVLQNKEVDEMRRDGTNGKLPRRVFKSCCSSKMVHGIDSSLWRVETITDDMHQCAEHLWRFTYRITKS